MSEWLKETDCKSVTVMLRWFESNSAQSKGTHWYQYRGFIDLPCFLKQSTKIQRFQ